MEITTQTLNTIASIYDVILDANQWDKVLDEFAGLTNCVGSNMMIADLVLQELTAIHVSAELQPAIPVYLERGYNKIDEAVIPNFQNIIPAQGFFNSADIYPIHNRRYGTDLDIGEFDQYMKSEHGIFFRYTSPLNYRKGFIDMATLHFGDVTKQELHETLDYANLYLPHFAKAIEVSRPFNLLKIRFNAILSVLDRFHLGVAIFSGDGSLVLSNRAAEDILESNDGLKLGRQNLSTTQNSPCNSDLKKAFAAANRVIEEGKDRKTNRVYIPRRSAGSSYIVDIAPLRNQEIDLKSQFRGVVAIILDPDNHQIIDVSGVEQLFALTPAEKEVCRLLVSGYTTAEIADTRGSNPDTVRKQINMLLNKTNTKHRSELVHLAHSINIPVDQAG